MKIRKGFVSNSSSSSFILECDKAPLNRVQTVEFLKTNPDVSLLIVGASLTEGDDIFFLDAQQVSFILDHEERFLRGFANWKAYIEPSKFKEVFSNFQDFEDSVDIEETLQKNEQLVWKDYNSESERDFEFFVNHYFLTSDEYSIYLDWLWGESPGRGLQGVIAYTEKTEDPNIPANWTDVYIGINEFVGYEGVGMFSSKKLTEGDLKRLRSGKLALKDGVSFYRDFKTANKNKKVVHFETGNYNIITMNSYFDKVKSLKYFLQERSDEN